MDAELREHFNAEARRHLDLARASQNRSVSHAHHELAALYLSRAADDERGEPRRMTDRDLEARRLDDEARRELSLARAQDLADRADRLRRDGEARPPLRSVLGLSFRN